MFKKSKIVASCLAVTSLALGVYALNGNVEVSADEPSLYFEGGAAIRISDDGLSDGLRFTAIASESFVAEKMNVDEDKKCTSYKTASEAFGMIIVPASYMSDYNAYKVAGGEFDYYGYFKNVKEKMINFEFAPTTISYNATKQAYVYAGAVANVNFNNMIMDYQSVVYYKNADGSYTYGEISDARSYGYVASAAYNRPKTAYDASISEKFVPIVEEAMYVASGVVFDYDEEVYCYAGNTSDDPANLVTLEPTMEISGSVTTLKLGETAQLIATASPYANVDVTWSVAENAPVTVENGLVTAKSAGTAVVTASYMKGLYSDTYEITVAKDVVALANTKDVETKVDNTLAFTGLIEGAVTDVAIGATTISGWTYDDATDTLSIPAASLVGVEVGEGKTLTVETATTAYTQKVWVVNKVVRNLTDLRQMFNYADVDTTNYAADGYFVLGSDITCEKRSWNSGGYQGYGISFWYASTLAPAGSPFFNPATAANFAGFVGTFDGRGYAIHKLPVVTGGLFYKIGEGGVVKNLILAKMNLVSGDWRENTASLAIENYGTIEKVMFSVGAIAKQASSSGLVMKNYGTIKNIHARIYFESSSWTDSFYAIGENQTGGTITNVVVSTNFADAHIKETVSGVPSWMKKVSGDGWSATNSLWYPRFGTAANGFCSEDGTNGRDGVFVIISDKIASANVVANNKTQIDAIS